METNNPSGTERPESRSQKRPERQRRRAERRESRLKSAETKVTPRIDRNSRLGLVCRYGDEIFGWLNRYMELMRKTGESEAALAQDYVDVFDFCEEYGRFRTETDLSGRAVAT